jgi:hypothetical protein
MLTRILNFILINRYIALCEKQNLFSISFDFKGLKLKKRKVQVLLLTFSYFCQMNILGKLIIGGAVDKGVLPTDFDKIAKNNLNFLRRYFKANTKRIKA